MYDIKYQIGDKVEYAVRKYDEEGYFVGTVKKTGYIFQISIEQAGVFGRGKKGYVIRYKIHSSFEDIHGGWYYVSQKGIISLIGVHPNSSKYVGEI